MWSMKKTHPIFWRAKLLIWPLALICVEAQGAADRFDLKLHVRPGETWNFDQSFEATQTTARSAGGKTVSKSEQQVRSVRQGTITVLAVSSGAPSAARITFAPSSSTRSKQTGTAEMEVSYPLAGKTVTLKRGADGKITPDFGSDPEVSIDPTTRGELESYLSGNEGRPPRPVAIGDQWEPTPAQLKQMYQLTGASDQAASVSRLASILATNGLRLAQVVVSNYVVRHPGGMAISELTQGSMWMDLDSGRVVRSVLNGRTAIKGTQVTVDSNGQQMPVELQSSVTSQARLEMGLQDSLRAALDLAEAPPVSPAIAMTERSEKLLPAVRGGAPNRGGSLPPSDARFAAPPSQLLPADRDNPPALNPASTQVIEPEVSSQSASDPWEGTFTDGDLTVELKAVAPGQYQGAILQDGRRYTLAGQGNASGLAGAFRGQGGTFEFAATQIGGGVIDFVSGGNSFRLTREGVNPLGVRAHAPQPAAPSVPGSATIPPQIPGRVVLPGVAQPPVR
jgi:hypothetical protein